MWRTLGRQSVEEVQVWQLKPKTLKALYFKKKVEAVESQVLSTRGQADANLHRLTTHSRSHHFSAIARVLPPESDRPNPAAVHLNHGLYFEPIRSLYRSLITVRDSRVKWPIA